MEIRKLRNICILLSVTINDCKLYYQSKMYVFLIISLNNIFFKVFLTAKVPILYLFNALMLSILLKNFP